MSDKGRAKRTDKRLGALIRSLFILENIIFCRIVFHFTVLKYSVCESFHVNVHLRERYFHAVFNEFFRNLFVQEVPSLPIIRPICPTAENEIERTFVLFIENHDRFGVFKHKRIIFRRLKQNIAYLIYIGTVSDSKSQIQTSCLLCAVIDYRGVRKPAVRKCYVLIL